MLSACGCLCLYHVTHMDSSDDDFFGSQLEDEPHLEDMMMEPDGPLDGPPLEWAGSAGCPWNDCCAPGCTSVASSSDGMQSSVGLPPASESPPPRPDTPKSSAGASESAVEPTARAGTEPSDEVFLPTQEEDTESKPKRLRLRTKQRPPEESFYFDTPTICDAPAVLTNALKLVRNSVVYVDEYPCARAWRSIPEGDQRRAIFIKLRAFYVRVVHARVVGPAHYFHLLTQQAKQTSARQAWAALTKDRRAELITTYLYVVEPPKWVRQVCQQCKVGMLEKTGSPLIGGRFRGILLTWMFPDDAVSISASPPPRDGEQTAALDVLVADLRAQLPVSKLWDKFRDHIQEAQKSTRATDVASSLEVCPETFLLQGKVKLHGHSFLRISEGAAFLELSNKDPLLFLGITPVPSTNLHGLSIKGSRSGSWAGFHYCCVPTKTGCVHCSSTKQPYTGYLVNPSWIMNMVQAGKLAPHHARPLLVRCVASRHIKELDAREEELEKAAVNDLYMAAQKTLGQSACDWKQFKEVQFFLAQFSGHAMHRYKFLVLAGPSRLGKTVFARSLSQTPERVLEINCAAGKEPDLRAYRIRHHDVIVFDEINPTQVLDQRKLFQSCAAPVQLGSSATNCHSYTVFVWQKLLVLCSNDWEVQVGLCSAAEQDWLGKNSVLLQVEAPMWVEPTASPSAQ